MINTSSTELATYQFRMFSEDQIQEILRAAFDVMRTVGFKILHPGARQMLKQAGAVVEEEIVKLPEHIAMACLASAPKGWTIFDRGGKRALEVTGRKSHFGTSTAAPNTLDARTGEFRPTLLDDIAIGARVADALEHIDFIMPFGSSQDVPGAVCDLYEFPVTVSNTTKPQVFISYSGRGVELVYEMAAAVAGGLERLQERPFVIAYPEPIAPMVYPDHVVDRIFAAADLNMPQIPAASVMLGATGPVTLAGAVAQALCESFMCLTLAQLRKTRLPHRAFHQHGHHGHVQRAFHLRRAHQIHRHLRPWPDRPIPGYAHLGPGRGHGQQASGRPGRGGDHLSHHGPGYGRAEPDP